MNNHEPEQMRMQPLPPAVRFHNIFYPSSFEDEESEEVIPMMLFQPSPVLPPISSQLEQDETFLITLSQTAAD